MLTGSGQQVLWKITPTPCSTHSPQQMRILYVGKEVLNGELEGGVVQHAWLLGPEKQAWSWPSRNPEYQQEESREKRPEME